MPRTACDVTPASPLDYAPPVPIVRTRWFRRTVLLSLLLAAVLGAWRFGGPVGRRAQMLWWQRSCMTFTREPGLVVYTDDQPEADRISRDAYLQMYRGGPAYYRDLPAYQALCSLVGYQAGSGGATLYMHARTNRAGNERLVVLYVTGSGADRLLSAGVMVPGSIGSPARWTSTMSYISLSPKAVPQGAPLRLFAGQDDASDASSFIVPWESGDQRGVLRGQLVGDAVRLQFE